MSETATRKSHRLLDKLIREVTRSELQTTEHVCREARQLGDTPPAGALRAVAEHATAMRSRFIAIVHAHGLPVHRSTFGATLASLKHLVVDRSAGAEEAYRATLVDLRHGIDVVKLLREIARRDELFGLIRWCDDWLGARRTLVASVEAQLAWFFERDASDVARWPASGDLALDHVDDRDDDGVMSSASDPDR